MTHIDRTKIKRLDGTLLLVFRELVHYRRTTAAGERLGLSQSAISHALARLRDLFDDPLFVRRQNGLVPTRHALEIAPMIDDIIKRAQETIDVGRTFDAATTRRHFRIGSADFMYTLVAAPMLKSFEQVAPSARLSFRMLFGDDALNSLLHDEIDVALGRFATTTDAVCAQVLFEDEFCVVARQGHPVVRGSIDCQTYVDLGHTIVTTSGDLADISESALQSFGIQRRVIASVPRFFVALTVVSESDGLATVPRRFAERYAAMLDLQVLPLPFHLPAPPIIALRRTESNGDPSIDWLIEQLRAATLTSRPGTQS